MSMLKFKDPQTGLWVSIPAAGGGLPSGGSTGQFLSKTVNGVAWVDILPAGSSGQFLKKTSGGIEWSDLPVYTSMKLLWTNASPSSSFAAQTISLDLSEYSIIAIASSYAVDNMIETWSFCSVGATGWLYHFVNYRQRRDISATASSVIFGNGQEAAQTGNLGTNNNVMIPYKIFGIKGVQ